MVSPRLLLLVPLLCGLAGVAQGARCNGQSTPGPPNENPIDDSAPVFVASVPNGKHYTVGGGEDMLDLIHVWGSPYDWGFAHGSLLKEKVNRFLTEAYTYMEEQVVAKAANNTILAWIAKVGLDAALDLSFDVTKKYTPAYAMEEIAGMAAALGVEAAFVRRIMWIGELTRGSCSMFGAWGNATASRGGKLLQLRALDWDVDGPFKNYPAVVVYHPSNASDGHAFANVGFTGWVASITGMSSQQLAVSEIGVSYPDESFGNSTVLTPGYPFGYLIRDILQFDGSLDDAINRVTGAKRTANLILGVGDGKANDGEGAFAGFQYSPHVANVFDDTNLLPVAPWHPRIEHVVYWGMDWICPNDNKMLSDQLAALHGDITAENTIKHIVPYVQTGDVHIAVYDHYNMLMYVANAAADDESGPPNAYDRTFLKFDMKALFAEQPPAAL